MDPLENLLQHVATLAASGAPESVINSTIAENGYSRSQFENAIRDRIEAQSTRPDKNWADRAVGTLREFLAGRTYEFADNMEAVMRLVSKGAPGPMGMATSAMSALGNPNAYQDELGNIQAERQNFRQVMPGQATAANVAGAMLAGNMEGKAVAQGLPMLAPQKGQLINNVARRAAEGAVTGAAGGAAYSVGQFDPRFDQNPTQSIGGDPNRTLQGNMLRDAVVSAAAGPVVGPVLEGAARAGGFLADQTQALAGRLRPGAGGGGAPPVPPAPPAGGAAPPMGGPGGRPSLQVGGPLRQEYDPYYQGLSKFADSLESDGRTLEMVRQEAERQGRAAGYDQVMAVDVGGINNQRFAKALYNAPGRGAEVAQTALEGRQLDQGNRMLEHLQNRLTQGKDPEVFAREGAQRRKLELGPEYDKIMEVGLPESLNPELRQLLDVDPKLQKLYEAKRIDERDFRGNPDPGPYEGNMSLRQVEVARKGLSEREGALLRKGKLDSAGALGEYRRRLMAQADEAVPQYGELRRQGFDDYRLAEVSKQASKDFYKARPEIMAEDFLKLTPVEKDAYRAGFVREMQAYLDPKISESATKSNIARSIDKKSLKDRIEILFDDNAQFAAYWESVLVEAQRSKSYLSTIGDATRNTGEMQRMASDNLVDPNPLDEAIQGATSPLSKLRELGSVMKTRELKRVSDAFGPAYFQPGLDNVHSLLQDAQLAREMQRYYNAERAARTGAGIAATRSLLY